MSEMEQALSRLLADPKYRKVIDNAGIFRFPSNYRFEWHRHRKIELNYVDTGGCIMGIGEEYVPLKEGEGILLYPGVAHSFLVDVRQSCRITQVEFTVDAPPQQCGFLPFLRGAVLGQPPRFYKLHDCGEISEQMKRICKNIRERHGGPLAQAKEGFAFAQLYLTLSEQILQEERRAQNEKESKVGPILRYIQENLEEKLDMEELCVRFGISSRYARKLFFEETGMNSSQYITMLRVSKAKELLWDLSCNITDVADRAGFASSQYFSRVFKTHAGMTPQEYRRAGMRADDKRQEEKI